jgi:hypothetical protein
MAYTACCILSPHPWYNEVGAGYRIDLITRLLVTWNMLAGRWGEGREVMECGVLVSNGGVGMGINGRIETVERMDCGRRWEKCGRWGYSLVRVVMVRRSTLSHSTFDMHISL